MIPQFFVELESIPLSPNGKVNRKVLPKPESVKIAEKNHVAPRTEVERAIAAVWQQVLQIDKIGVHENFFDLGGHSLLMVRVKSQIQGFLKKEISIITLFQYPTIDAFCRYLFIDEGKQSSFNQINRRAKKQEDAMILQQMRGRIQRKSSE
jgi:hypothetical protein